MLRNAHRTWHTIEDTFIHHIEKNDQYDENDPIHQKSTRMNVAFRMISEDQEDGEDLKDFFIKEHSEWILCRKMDDMYSRGTCQKFVLPKLLKIGTTNY